MEEGVQKIKKITVNLSNSLPEKFQYLLQEHFHDNSAGSVEDQFKELKVSEKHRQDRTEQIEESPVSSPARIATKYSDVSELDQSRENPGEAIDKKCKPGRDIEIDDYIGSPTLRPHLLPKNKAGQFPSWYDSDDNSTLSVPGGELEDPVPQRSTNSDFDRLLEATQKRQPKQSKEQSRNNKKEETPEAASEQELCSQEPNSNENSQESSQEVDMTNPLDLLSMINDIHHMDMDITMVYDLYEYLKGSKPGQLQDDSMTRAEVVVQLFERTLKLLPDELLLEINAKAGLQCPPNTNMRKHLLKNLSENLLLTISNRLESSCDTQQVNKDWLDDSLSMDQDHSEMPEMADQPADGNIVLPENKGNSCFATTSMHCLLLSKPFRRLLEENRQKQDLAGEICRLVLGVVKEPQGQYLNDILKKLFFQENEQADCEEFLQELLETTTGIEFQTEREEQMKCTECQKLVGNHSHIEKRIILNIPLKQGETENLQAEVERLKKGITYHECSSRKCKKQKTIHEVICYNGVLCSYLSAYYLFSA